MLQRPVLPLLVSAFLVAFSLGRSPQIRVPSQVGPLQSLRTVASHQLLGAPLEGAVRLTRPVVPTGADADIHVVLDLAAAASSVKLPAPRLNLVLVLDRSGSMRAEGKLRQAVHAASRLVARLGPEDTLSLVTYSTDAQLLLPAAPVESGEAAQEALRSIRAGGSTNISEGLELALRQASRYRGPDRLTAVLLLSDGKANHGLTERGALGELAARMRSNGVALSSFGLGLSYEELTLQDLARLGGGEYYFLDTAAVAEEVFERERTRLEKARVRDVEVLLTPENGTRLLATDGGYSSELFPDGTMRIRLGTLSAGAVRQAVVRARVPATLAGTNPAVVRVQIAYQSAIDGSWMSGSQEARLGVVAGSESAVEASRDVAASSVVERSLVATALESAAEGLVHGKVEEAQRTLQALERAPAAVRQLERELGRIQRDEERSRWLKQSRAKAFLLRR